MANITTRVEELLIEAGAELYVRGTALVRPLQESQIASNGQTTRTVALHEVEKVYLRDRMNKAIRFERFDMKAKDWVTANAPMDVAETLLARKGEWKMPPVGGVINCPTLRPDGTILSERGYDEQTGLILFGGVELPKMPDKPTRQQAVRALAQIDELIAEFPFVDEPSKSVARSSLITPVVRGCMSVAPLHVISAPAAGTGKSYVVDLGTAIALGERCSVMSVSSNLEETEKRLGAKAMAGHPIISLDNVNGELGGDALCQLVSQPICEIRVLGFSKMPRVVNRFCVFANGNNITLRGDLTRRALTCRLDAKVEKPFERPFKAKPFERIISNRGVYVAACLTIVQAFFAAGRPKQRLAPMNSFEDWSETVRSALVWLGCADPAITVGTSQADDPERQAIATFIAAMQSEVGVGQLSAITAAQMIARAHEKVALREALSALPIKAGSSLSLGKWLKKSQDRQIGAVALKAVEMRAGYVGYYAEVVQ
jgi:putative DNA primase/helicase